MAILEGGGHGLLEEDVLARGERGHSDLRVQVIRHRHHDGVDVGTPRRRAYPMSTGTLAKSRRAAAAVASLAQAMAASSAPGALAMAAAWCHPHRPYPIRPKRMVISSLS